MCWLLYFLSWVSSKELQMWQSDNEGPLACGRDARASLQVNLSESLEVACNHLDAVVRYTAAPRDLQRVQSVKVTGDPNETLVADQATAQAQASQFLHSLTFAVK